MRTLTLLFFSIFSGLSFAVTTSLPSTDSQFIPKSYREHSLKKPKLNIIKVVKIPTKKRSLKKKNDSLKRLLHRDHFSYASRIAKQYGCQDVIWKLPGDYRWLGKARPVVMKSGYYVDTQPLSIKKKSSWLQKPISLAAHKMPLNILISRLLRDTKVKVTYRNAAQPNRLVTLDYTGSLQGALQSVSEQTNYHYRLNKNNLVWFYDKNS